MFLVGAVASFGRVALLKLAGERLVARLRTQTFAALLAKGTCDFALMRSGPIQLPSTDASASLYRLCAARARHRVGMPTNCDILLMTDLTRLMWLCCCS